MLESKSSGKASRSCCLSQSWHGWLQPGEHLKSVSLHVPHFDHKSGKVYTPNIEAHHLLKDVLEVPNVLDGTDIPAIRTLVVSKKTD
jgi:hypothetical protein